MMETQKVLFKGKLSEKALERALEIGVPLQSQRRREGILDLQRKMQARQMDMDPHHARKDKPDTGVQVVRGDKVFADVSYVISDLIDAGFRVEDVHVFRKNVGSGQKPQGGFLVMVFVMEEGENVQLDGDAYEFVDNCFKSTWQHCHVWDNSNTGRPITVNCISRSTERARCQLRLQNEEWMLVNF